LASGVISSLETAPQIKQLFLITEPIAHIISITQNIIISKYVQKKFLKNTFLEHDELNNRTVKITSKMMREKTAQ
jgi:ABC-type polysaccharide/polyol phosphate export permease